MTAIKHIYSPLTDNSTEKTKKLEIYCQHINANFKITRKIWNTYREICIAISVNELSKSIVIHDFNLSIWMQTSRIKFHKISQNFWKQKIVKSCSIDRYTLFAGRGVGVIKYSQTSVAHPFDESRIKVKTLGW